EVPHALQVGVAVDRARRLVFEFRAGRLRGRRHDEHEQQKVLSHCLFTPLTSSQTPTGISNAAIGTNTSFVMTPLTRPEICSGRNTTRMIEATRPIHARAAGMIRPRRSSQQNSVLPRAKYVAPY